METSPFGTDTIPKHETAESPLLRGVKPTSHVTLYEKAPQAAQVVELERPTPTRETYRVKGVDYPRVTTILGSAPGGHLMPWYAKQAALAAAFPLVAAGLYEPDPATDQALIEYVLSRAEKSNLAHDDAVRMACDVLSNMKEPERYRDHKARIGSVSHHAFYDRALTGQSCGEKDIYDYLSSLAVKVLANPEYEKYLERMSLYGKTVQSETRALASAAAPVVRNIWQWFEDYQPEFDAIGLEAVVVNEEFMYAGTKDCEVRFRRFIWEAVGKLEWAWPGQDAATTTGDLKTSNHLPKNVLAQGAMYDYADYMFLQPDGSVHKCEPTDGVVAIHATPDSPVTMKAWGREATLEAFDAACDLCGWFRYQENLPRSAGAKRKRSEKQSPKEKRVVDF